jgi:hypothetical protein
MARLQFLLECCTPGSAPDPVLLASVLDLPHTPVLARACFLLHCAHLVHECNRGNWPAWLRAQATGGGREGRTGGRPSLVPSLAMGRGGRVQLQAGRLFHQWGEVRGGQLASPQALGCRLAAMLAAEPVEPEVAEVPAARQKELLAEDEEEDFLDEATVNPTGRGCPAVIRLTACMLLLEITVRLLPHPLCPAGLHAGDLQDCSEAGPDCAQRQAVRGGSGGPQRRAAVVDSHPVHNGPVDRLAPEPAHSRAWWGG